MVATIARHLVHFLLLLAFLPPTAALASSYGSGGSVYVHSYIRSNGSYVAPHYQSPPDGLFYNNWSTSGNINPYTGKVGTRLTPPSNYSWVRTVLWDTAE